MYSKNSMSESELLQYLDTEQVNQQSLHIDEMSTQEILSTINSEDQTVALCVQKVLPSITHLVNAIYPRLKDGGRLFYLGAGTSGRLGVLDASECPPTYGVSPDLIQGIMAGGMSALLKAKEGAEDSLTLAQNDLTQLALCSKDSVIGIAASGRTPYVIGGLDFANSIGALTGSISCVKNAQLSYHSTYSIECIVGPEIITGSTRMKAGTAQKMILNMISTTLMIQYGKVYQNLMVDVQPTNDKLIDRSIRIISSASNIPFEDALYYYDLSDKNVKLAICMAITKQNKSICEIELLHHNGNVSKAINYLKGSINE